MELANLRYLTYNGKSCFKKSCRKVPGYRQAKSLDPVIVDDFLKLDTEEANVKLFKSYIEDKFLVVPIRRRRDGGGKKADNFPSRVLLEITSKCNLKCVMCPRNALKRPEMHMPKEIIKRCIDEVDNHGVDGLWLYYIGDALLHPDFEEIFHYCQSKKNLGSLWLSTNGQNLSDATIDMFLKSNLRFLNYSLNAMSQQSYRLICPLGNYENLVSSLNKSIQRKRELKMMGLTPWMRVQMIDQPQVVAEIDSFLAYYSERCEILSINMLEAFSQNIVENVEYVKERKRRMKMHCNRINRSDCFIFSDGWVSFCDTDFNHEMAIGNIYDSTIEEIWTGSEHRKYEALNKQGRLDDIPLCGRCLDYDL